VKNGKVKGERIPRWTHIDSIEKRQGPQELILDTKAASAFSRSPSAAARAGIWSAVASPAIVE
jgi:hypothetical protein